MKMRGKKKEIEQEETGFFVLFLKILKMSKKLVEPNEC